MYRFMSGGLSSAGMSDIGSTVAKYCRFLCQYFWSRFQLRPKTVRLCLAHACGCVLKKWSKIIFPPATIKKLIRKGQTNCHFGAKKRRKKNRSEETVVMSEVCFFFAFYYVSINHRTVIHCVRFQTCLLDSMIFAQCGNFVCVHRFPSKFQR